MVETQAIYLTVLESGMSLIAVNLPSIWYLFAKIKPESVLRSVRSIISLPSSSHSKSSHAPDKSRNHSSSSISYLAHPEGQTLETYAMHDIDDGAGVPPVPYGNIGVKATFTQTAERV